MTMKTIDRKIAGVTVVDVSGRIVLGEDTALLRNTVRDLIATGQKNILLNLAEVPYLDSGGIGELVSAFVAVRREGGNVKLLNLTRRVRGILEIVKLITIFEVFDDEAAALESFARPEDGARDLKARAS